MGFGCADAGGLDFNGAPAPLAGVPSIAYPDFLKALDNNVSSIVSGMVLQTLVANTLRELLLVLAGSRVSRFSTA